ncbi:hypothetical protein [Tsukamurella tyrosinosolvens]|uniref:hypothetical protein n=1 Tax=Tsukamurella tyrosinosolvens TaxID=57704 RepID=UPI00125EB504|nr:hypothetical protein [Tsukamurella tyrosinosolvens]
MNARSAARLWLIRVLEGQLGLSSLLASKADVKLLATWMAIAAELDRDIDGLCGNPDPEAARRLFFTSQALMEKFVIERISYDAMADWTEHSARIHRQLTAMADPRAEFPARLHAQLDLYDSAVHSADGRVTVDRCGIWSYREQRRAAGTPITLKSPCEFCTKSVSANARHQNLAASVNLRERGCEWTFA